MSWIAAVIMGAMLTHGLKPAAALSEFEPIVVAQAATSQKKPGRGSEASRVPLQGVSEREMRVRINAWVVGVAAGKLEGAPIRLVEEMSRVLDDGDDMQILPIITRGPSYNVHALLYLRGIDLAVINGDVLDYFAKQKNIPRIAQRINYVTQLFNSEVHVLARPEIRSLADLAGKPVNFNTKGTSAAFSGPAVFDKLGIKVKKTFIPHPVAMQQMKKSDRFAAVVFVTAKPVRPLVKKKWPKGFRLLAVPFSDKVSEFFLPTALEAKDYPDLIEPGGRVETIAVPTVLAAYNWPKNSVRQRRVSRFVDYLFERWERLQQPPFHPKWREINLAAKIPGWQRLPSVQAKLDARGIPARAAARQNRRPAGGGAGALAASRTADDRERLFQQFMEWVQKNPEQQARR